MIAALFPGQGSQAIGMASDFYQQSPAARSVLDEAEATLPGLLEIMWQGSEAALRLTANQQPALVAAGAAAFAAYREAGGAPPGFAAGHSLGEFSAYVAAGSLALAQALRLVRRRGVYMQEAVPLGEGAMAAVLTLEPTLIAKVCKEVGAELGAVVHIANLNAPGQTVISGEAGAVTTASQRLKGEGGRIVPLKVSAPFHCALMRPAAERLEQDLAQTSFAPPTFPIVSNVTAEVVENVREIPRLLTEQVTHAVRWVESMKALAAAGVDIFLEFGSGSVLTGLTRRILPDVKAASIADMASLKEAL